MSFPLIACIFTRAIRVNVFVWCEKLRAVAHTDVSVELLCSCIASPHHCIASRRLVDILGKRRQIIVDGLCLNVFIILAVCRLTYARFVRNCATRCHLHTISRLFQIFYTSFVIRFNICLDVSFENQH